MYDAQIPLDTALGFLLQKGLKAVWRLIVRMLSLEDFSDKYLSPLDQRLLNGSPWTTGGP